MTTTHSVDERVVLDELQVLAEVLLLRARAGAEPVHARNNCPSDILVLAPHLRKGTTTLEDTGSVQRTVKE